jgi:GTP-binding protein EngB required for normal cell division
MHYYLKNTPTNDDQLILVLIDLMHGLKQTDIMLFDMLHSLKKNFMIVFTKSDRSKAQDFDEGKAICKKIQEIYANMNFFVHFTSVL